MTRHFSQKGSRVRGDPFRFFLFFLFTSFFFLPDSELIHQVTAAAAPSHETSAVLSSVGAWHTLPVATPGLAQSSHPNPSRDPINILPVSSLEANIARHAHAQSRSEPARGVLQNALVQTAESAQLMEGQPLSVDAYQALTNATAPAAPPATPFSPVNVALLSQAAGTAAAASALPASFTPAALPESAVHSGGSLLSPTAPISGHMGQPLAAISLTTTEPLEVPSQSGLVTGASPPAAASAGVAAAAPASSASLSTAAASSAASSPAASSPTSAPPAVASPAASPPASASPAVASPAASSPASASPAVATSAASPPASASPAVATSAASSPASASPGVASPAAPSPASASPASASPAVGTSAALSPASASPASASPAVATSAASSPASASPASVSPAVATSAASSPASASPAVATSVASSPASSSPGVASPAAASPAATSPASQSPAAALPAAASSAAASPVAASPAGAPPPSAAAASVGAAEDGSPGTAVADAATTGGSGVSADDQRSASMSSSRTKMAQLLSAVASRSGSADDVAESEPSGTLLGTALGGNLPADSLYGMEGPVTMPLASAAVDGQEPEDTKSCFNHCSCTPVIVVSALLFATCCVSVVVATVMMGSLFSKGFASSAFFFGGGYAILAASLFGLATGSICGGVVAGCWPAALSFGGGTLAFACGIVLLGRRGAWLGALGGIATGGSIAGLVDPSAFPISLGCVMGLLLGIVIGFAPIFRDLKMNSRYIRHGLQTPEGTTSSIRSSQHDYSKPPEAFQRGHKMSPSAAATRSASGLKLRSSPSRSVDSRATTGSRASGFHEAPLAESAASPTQSVSNFPSNKEGQMETSNL